MAMSESSADGTDRLDDHADNGNSRTADVAELADRIDRVNQKYDQYNKQVLKPRIDELESARDDAREERAELKKMVQDLQQSVAMLEERLDNIAGLADDQETTPQKRVADLREAMIRRAEAREDNDRPAKVAMYYQEVQDLFADYGHGEIVKPDCYKAMDEAAEMPGFELGTKKSDHGNDVRAIRLDLEALRAEASGRNPTTRDMVANARDSAETATKNNSD